MSDPPPLIAAFFVLDEATGTCLCHSNLGWALPASLPSVSGFLHTFSQFARTVDGGDVSEVLFELPASPKPGKHSVKHPFHQVKALHACFRSGELVRLVAVHQPSKTSKLRVPVDLLVQALRGTGASGSRPDTPATTESRSAEAAEVVAGGGGAGLDDGKSTAGVEESKGEEGVSFATPSTAALRRPVHEERQLTFLEALHVVLQTFERRYQHLITPGARDVWRRMLDRDCTESQLEEATVQFAPFTEALREAASVMTK